MGKSLLHQETKTNVITNILIFIYKPVEEKHNAVMKNICIATASSGFRHKSVRYSPYAISERTVLGNIHEEFIEDWEKHLHWYEQMNAEKEKVRWALAAIISPALDVKTIWDLLPISVQSYSGVTQDMLIETFSTAASSDIQTFKQTNKKYYALVEASIIRRVLVI